jgi:hypothetical protein
MSQIALPLTQSGQSGPDSIIIGECNRPVAEALGSSRDWPFGTAILAGPPRSGKSLFARWFASHTGGGALDDADTKDETEIFHAWNRAREDNYPLLLTVSSQGWEIALPDLRSRMGAALQLEIGPPDDEMAAQLMLGHAAQRGLALGEGAPAYLVPRMERSHAAIERIVKEIDRLSLERKVPATMSIWRDALDAVQGPEQARLL